MKCVTTVCLFALTSITAAQDLLDLAAVPELDLIAPAQDRLEILVPTLALIDVGQDSDNAEVPIEADDRLRIEIVPIIVQRSHRQRGEWVFEQPPVLDATDQFIEDTHRALEVLDVRQDEYELALWQNQEGQINYFVIACRTFRKWIRALATPDAINCIWGEEQFSTERESFAAYTWNAYGAFVENTQPPKLGTIYLFALLPEEVVGNNWYGTHGNARHLTIVDGEIVPVAARAHYSNDFCVAFALNTPVIIAHELGHCFGLDHTTGERWRDLMLDKAKKNFWLHDSSKTIVRSYMDAE